MVAIREKSPPDPAPVRPHHLQPVVAAAGVWVALSTLFAVSVAADYRLRGIDEPLLQTWWSAGGIWLVFGLCAPVGLVVARGRNDLVLLRPDGVGRVLVGWLVFHLSVQSVFTAAETWVVLPLQGIDGGAFAERWVAYVVRRLALSAIAFAGVIGVDHLRATTRREQEQRLRASEYERLAVHARLEALGAQLRPHFLFNTLNGVLAALRTDPSVSERMLMKLATLLRASLRTESSHATLEEELALAAHYLDIQADRFGHRLMVAWHVEPVARGVRVPALILQPLLENAVRHGVEWNESGGSIGVQVAQEREVVSITIENDCPSPRPEHVGTGVGLENVRARLAACYPDGGGTLTIDTLRGRFRATIHLPTTGGVTSDADS